MRHPTDIMIQANRETALIFYKTKADAEWAAKDMSSDDCTFKVEAYGGQFVLNAYDEEGGWMGRF